MQLSNCIPFSIIACQLSLSLAISNPLHTPKISQFVDEQVSDTMAAQLPKRLRRTNAASPIAEVLAPSMGPYSYLNDDHFICFAEGSPACNFYNISLQNQQAIHQRDRNWPRRRSCRFLLKCLLSLLSWCFFRFCVVYDLLEGRDVYTLMLIYDMYCITQCNVVMRLVKTLVKYYLWNWWCKRRITWPVASLNWWTYTWSGCTCRLKIYYMIEVLKCSSVCLS